MSCGTHRNPLDTEDTIDNCWNVNGANFLPGSWVERAGFKFYDRYHQLATSGSMVDKHNFWAPQDLIPSGVKYGLDFS